MAMAVSHHELTPPVFETPVRVLIVVAPYYKEISDALTTGATAACEAARVMYDVIEDRKSVV